MGTELTVLISQHVKWVTQVSLIEYLLLKTHTNTYMCVTWRMMGGCTNFVCKEENVSMYLSLHAMLVFITKGILFNER